MCPGSHIIQARMDFPGWRIFPFRSFSTSQCHAQVQNDAWQIPGSPVSLRGRQDPECVFSRFVWRAIWAQVYNSQVRKDTQVRTYSRLSTLDNVPRFGISRFPGSKLYPGSPVQASPVTPRLLTSAQKEIAFGVDESTLDLTNVHLVQTRRSSESAVF